MATTDDYVRLGLDGFLALCEQEWQHTRTANPVNPVAQRLEIERRAIERRHRRRVRKDRRRGSTQHTETERSTDATPATETPDKDRAA